MTDPLEGGIKDLEGCALAVPRYLTIVMLLPLLLTLKAQRERRRDEHQKRHHTTNSHGENTWWKIQEVLREVMLFPVDFLSACWSILEAIYKCKVTMACLNQRTASV